MKEFRPPRPPSASSLPACKLNSAAEPVMRNVAEPDIRNDPHYIHTNIAFLESVLMLRRHNTDFEQYMMENPYPPNRRTSPSPPEFPLFKEPLQFPPVVVGYHLLNPQIHRMIRHEEQRMKRNAEAMLQRSRLQRDFILQHLRSRGRLAAEGDQQPPAASIGGATAEGDQQPPAASIGGDQQPPAASIGGATAEGDQQPPAASIGGDQQPPAASIGGATAEGDQQPIKLNRSRASL